MAVGEQEEKQVMEAQAEVAAQQAMAVLNTAVRGSEGVADNLAMKRRGGSQEAAAGLRIMPRSAAVLCLMVLQRMVVLGVTAVPQGVSQTKGNRVLTAVLQAAEREEGARVEGDGAG